MARQSGVLPLAMKSAMAVLASASFSSAPGDLAPRLNSGLGSTGLVAGSVAPSKPIRRAFVGKVA